MSDGVEWGSVGQWVGATATFIASVVALRTSNHSQKAFMLDKRPYLAFDKIELSSGTYAQYNKIITDRIYITLKLKNLGKTSANYEVENLTVNVGNTIDATVDANIGDIGTEILKDKYKSTGRILPESDGLVVIPTIKGKFKNDVYGTISFTIIYYRDETDEKYEWNMKMGFTAELEPAILESESLYSEIMEDNEKIVRTKMLDKIKIKIGL